ncbi:hypothetical protein G7Y89_g12978 [Cudoniella acicularis]|uniref:DUF7514 domain-containing protein n=1 Tax=Cudoniella acicularis TaxID=354080 RepID=A0A8H4RAF5_9HELO|nr:hypothetical protein G7Y89_g12978 [Cudoniella acicularis]
MVEFYSRFELQDKNYPLKTIFQNLSPKQISWLYEDLHCEYHLVGDGDVGKRPKIPALTPLGFDTWMTLLMLAYPNKEAERLQKIVEAMPIDADGVLVERKPERLPKQLSRHLLPPEAHRESKKALDRVLSEFKDLTTSNQTPSRNSKTSRLPPQHHNDLYSRELPTPQPRQERFAKTNLYSESSYHGQTNKTGNGRQTNNVQRGRTKPYVHNSRPNNDL